jgi:hypothetical protein
MSTSAVDMDSVRAAPTPTCHMVAMPYPGRSHINSMMNFCKILASKKPDILVTFVVTEEWLGFIGPDPKPDNIRLASIPNVVPSELVRAADLNNFVEAAMTKIEAPTERLLDQLEPLPTVLVAEIYLFWEVGFGGSVGIFRWGCFGLCRLRCSRSSNISIFLPKTVISQLTSQVLTYFCRVPLEQLEKCVNHYMRSFREQF